MAGSPAKFAREVRQEVGKVVWPSRKETLISTAMVLVLTFMAGVLFLVIDSLISLGVQAVLGLGG